MKPRFLLSLLYLAQTLFCYSQSWQWGVRGGSISDMGSTGGKLEEKVIDICTDLSGNVYFVAHVNGNVTPTVTGYPASTGGYGEQDILLLSYDCNGSFRWKKTIGGYGTDGVNAIGVDSLGHVYIAGVTRQPPVYPWPLSQPTPVHFDTDSTIPFSNFKSQFIARYDTVGTLNWIRWIAPDTVSRNNQQYYVRDMFVSKDGRIDLMCSLTKGLIGGGATTWVADSTRNYILSYNKEGDIISLIKPDFHHLKTRIPRMRMSRNKDGRFVIAGWQEYLANDGRDTLLIGGQKVWQSDFVACFNSQWQLLWYRVKEAANQLGGAQYRPVIDDNGNVYNFSEFQSPASFHGINLVNTMGPSAVPYAVKIDSTGTVKWIKCAASPYRAIDGAIAKSSNGKIYITGSYPMMKWDNHELSNPINSSYDIYLAELDDETGTVIKVDSLKSDLGHYDVSTAMTADNRGNVYLGIMMANNLVVNGNNLVSVGKEDFVVAKYGTASCSSGIVPLKMVEFSVRAHPLPFENGVEARWTTVNEYNVWRHNVQRSADGLKYKNIGTVPAKNTNQNQYSFLDNEPLEGTGFYRIESIDMDGSNSYSEVREITLTGRKSVILVYPNPATQVLNIRAVSIRKVTVTDITGRLLKAAEFNCVNEVQITVEELPKGMYLVTVVDNAGSSASQKLFIQ